METFDFNYHSFSTKYPETGTRMKLGKSYTYTASSTAPPQRTITLHFDKMQVLMISPGVPDVTSKPEMNFMRLDAFYRRHELHASFLYKHELYGDLVVKFAKPLEMPRVARGGWVPAFTLELEEQP